MSSQSRNEIWAVRAGICEIAIQGGDLQVQCEIPYTVICEISVLWQGRSAGTILGDLQVQHEIPYTVICEISVLWGGRYADAMLDDLQVQHEIL